MQETKKAIIIIVIAIAVLVGIIYFVQRQKSGEFNPPKEKGIELQTPAPEAPKPVAPEEVGAGETGETKETLEGEKIVVLPAEPGGPPQVLPPAIFNDSGEIKEIKADSLVILGSGYNFADQKSRDLTLRFTVATRTNSADRTNYWTGPEGLEHLAVGDKITFEAPENIRGKTEFEVTYVNKL